MALTDEQLVERMNARKAPTSRVFNSHIEEIRSADGYVRMRFDVSAEFCNPMGNVQGGIVTALLDDACAIACIVMSGKRIYVPTLELKTSFFAPAKKGILFAEAQVIKLGRTIAFMEAELKDAEGRILAKMSTTTAPKELPQEPMLVEGKSE
jgi:uncharacterized protein (TIGR00369 family)